MSMAMYKDAVVKLIGGGNGFAVFAVWCRYCAAYRLVKAKRFCIRCGNLITSEAEYEDLAVGMNKAFRAWRKASGGLPPQGENGSNGNVGENVPVSTKFSPNFHLKPLDNGHGM